MMNFINIYSLLFILKVMQTDANVRIYQSGVEAGSGHFECGEAFVLTCQIDNYSVTMALQNDSSIVPLAECFLNTCTLDPDVANIYALSTNTATGTFNLTFDVSNYQNGTTFMCGDGSNTNSSLFLMNDYRPTLIETNQTQLKVVSGCIDSGVKVKFRWEKLEANTLNKSVYELDSSNKPEEYDNATACVLDEDCGGPGLIQKLMSIYLEEGEGGGQDEYYLEAILSYDDLEVDPIRTSKTYKIKQVSGPERRVWDITDYALATSIGITFGLHLIAVAVLCYHTLQEKDLFLRSTYKKTGLISVPIYLCLALCIANWIRCSCTNPCPSCEYMSSLRYTWIAVVIVHYGYGFYRLKKIREHCNDKDAKEKNGVVNLGEDTEFIINLFYFIILTDILLLIVWKIYTIDEGRKLTPASSKQTPASTKQTPASTKQTPASTNSDIEKKNQNKTNLPSIKKNATPQPLKNQALITAHLEDNDIIKQTRETPRTDRQLGRERTKKEGVDQLPTKTSKRKTADISANNANQGMSKNTESKNGGDKKKTEVHSGRQNSANNGGAHDATDDNTKNQALPEQKEGKKIKDTRITNKDNLKHSGEKNGAKNSDTAHDSEIKNDNRNGPEKTYNVKEDINKNSNKYKAHGHNGDENQGSTADTSGNNKIKDSFKNENRVKGEIEKTSNTDNLEKDDGQKCVENSETAHDSDNKNDNKSGSERKYYVKEDMNKNSNKDKAHGHNGDENQGNMALVHRTKIFVNRQAQSNIVVQPVDGSTVRQNSADKQSAHTYIPRGISTVFTDPEDNDPQPS